MPAVACGSPALGAPLATHACRGHRACVTATPSLKNYPPPRPPLIKNYPISQVPIVVLAPQPVPTQEEPFYQEPPPFWHPSVVTSPQAIDVPSAPPLPPELLQPNAPFWTRTLSNTSKDGSAAAAAAAAAVVGVAAPPPATAVAAAGNGAKYPSV